MPQSSRPYATAISDIFEISRQSSYFAFPKRVTFITMTAFHTYISIDPEIRFGKPCIKGTRISVADILQWLASGMTNIEILEDFPQLQNEHILAALGFAANRDSFIKIIPA